MERWPRKTKFPLAIGRGKLKSRWILPAGQILLFQCGKRWQDEGQWEGKKAESEIPNVPEQGGQGQHVLCTSQGCRKEELGTFICVPKDAPKDKDLLCCPCLCTGIGANQNIYLFIIFIIWLGFLERHKGTENGVQNLSLEGKEQK